MKPKPERAALLLEAIRQFWADNGYPPGIRDLVRMTGIKSTSQIRKHLLTLQDAGVVDWEFNKSRTLHLTAGDKS